MELVQANDQKHEKGHTRLREDVTALESKVERHDEALKSIEACLTRIEDTLKKPIDAMKLSFTPRVVAVLVMTVLSGIGGQWIINYGQREELKANRVMMENATKLTDERAAAARAAAEAEARLQTERSASMSDKISELQKAMEMRRLEIQAIRDIVQQRK